MFLPNIRISLHCGGPPIYGLCSPIVVNISTIKPMIILGERKNRRASGHWESHAVLCFFELVRGKCDRWVWDSWDSSMIVWHDQDNILAISFTQQFWVRVTPKKIQKYRESASYFSGWWGFSHVSSLSWPGSQVSYDGREKCRWVEGPRSVGRVGGWGNFGQAELAPSCPIPI